MTITSPSRCPEERSKAKEVENYQYTSALMMERLKLFCEGCLVVRSGHGPQAEVAQGVGPEPLVEL